jgi:hypothetical protein
LSGDESLLRRAEEALSEIDRTDGLSEENADVLAALRIRIYGKPKQTLDDALAAAGDLKGKYSIDEPPPPKKKKSLDDALGEEPKKKKWPGEE